MTNLTSIHKINWYSNIWHSQSLIEKSKNGRLRTIYWTNRQRSLQRTIWHIKNMYKQLSKCISVAFTVTYKILDFRYFHVYVFKILKMPQLKLNSVKILFNILCS